MSVNPSVNILLTEVCLGRCPYCFNGAISERTSITQNHFRDEDFMKLEHVEIALNFLKRSNITHVRLMGGEPFLYPCFGELMSLVYNACSWDSIIIFTSGIFPQKTLSCITDDNAHLVFNVNEPNSYTANQYGLIRENIEIAVHKGLLVSFGLNVYEVGFEYKFIVELATEFGVSNIRICLANPSGNIKTKILRDAPRRQVGSRLLEMVEACSMAHVNVVFDCILPPCIFSDEEYGRLARLVSNKAMRDGVCNPAIDIRPDLTVHRCFALGNDLRVSLDDFQTSSDISNFFLEKTDHFKWLIAPSECANCFEYLNQKCQGDCLGFQTEELSRIRNKEFTTKHLFDDAYCALNRGDVQKAINIFEEAIDQYPYNGGAICDYLFLLVKHGSIEKAESIYSAYANIIKTESRGKELFVKGFLAESINDHNIATSCYRGALKEVKLELRNHLISRIAGLVKQKNAAN